MLTYNANTGTFTGIGFKSGTEFFSGMRVKLVTVNGKLVFDIAGATDFDWVGWIVSPGYVPSGDGPQTNRFSGNEQIGTIVTRHYGGNIPIVMNSPFKAGDKIYIADGGGHTNVEPTPDAGKTVSDYLVGICVAETALASAPTTGQYPQASVLPCLNACWA